MTIWFVQVGVPRQSKAVPSGTGWPRTVWAPKPTVTRVLVDWAWAGSGGRARQSAASAPSAAFRIVREDNVIVVLRVVAMISNSALCRADSPGLQCEGIVAQFPAAVARRAEFAPPA